MNLALDLDGTLITCAPRQMAVLRSVLAAMRRPCDLQAVWSAKRDGANTTGALVQAGLAQAEAVLASARWQAMVEEPCWLQLDRLFDDSRLQLNLLSQSMHRLILITARRRADHLHRQLVQLGIARLFDQVHVVGPTQAAISKSVVLRDVAAHAMVGDSESDAKAAQMAGVPFFAVTGGQRSASFLAAQGITNIYSCLTDAVQAASFDRSQHVSQ